jgi:CubicO group peptidase (beta-lactamase class C family)
MAHSMRVVGGIVALLSLATLSSAESAGPAPAAACSGLQEVKAEALDTYIRAAMHAARIPGLALALVDGDRVACLKGYGIADPDGRPVTPRTPFILGSTSKSFTALAVMQLVEKGKIDLDAPVTRYLPWFRTRDAAASARITVRHLLDQTSGLQTYEGRRGFWDNDQGSDALERGVRELATAPLRHPPGDRFEYANQNYNTLGLIVQVVSGTSYEEYVRSAIFAPLQMRHSAAALSDPAVADIASGYRYWLGWPVSFDAPYPRRMTPAGQLVSSAEDMAHYVVAQLNGGRYAHAQLLSAPGITALHRPASSMGPATWYGMGWAVQGGGDATTIWHDGDESNFHSHVRLLPGRRLGIVVLMNVGGFNNGAALNGVVEGIAATLLGARPAAPNRSVWPTSSDVVPMVPPLLAILWAEWTHRSLRRWRYVALAVELGSLGLIWVLLPLAVQTPMAAIALFAPDVFAGIVAATVIAVGCAAARTAAAFRSLPLAGPSTT